MSVQAKYYNLEEIILNQLVQWDSDYLFTLDCYSDRFKNIASKIKIVAAYDPKTLLGMAMGYCQASLKPSIIILQDSQNLIDCYGTIKTAHDNNLPLIILYFSQEKPKTLVFDDENDDNLTQISKLTIRANYLDEVAMCLKQAYNSSHTLPKSPVFIQANQSVINQSISNLQIFDNSLINSFNPPSSSFIKKISKSIFEANNPIAIIGDQVNFCGARKDLESFAQIINIPVYAEETCCNVNFPSNNEFFLGHLPDSSQELSKILEANDVILLIGLQNINTSLIETLFKFANSKTIIQINIFYDNFLSQIPCNICSIGDIGETLVKIQSEIQVLFNQDWLNRAKARKNEIINKNLNLLQAIKKSSGKVLSIELIMSIISQLKPLKSTMVCSQNLKIHRYSICFDWTNSSAYFSFKNSQAGIELSQALGVRLAAKSSQAVIAISPIESLSELINSYVISRKLNLDISYIFLTSASSSDYSNYLSLFNIPTIESSDSLEAKLAQFFRYNSTGPKFINIVYSNQ